MARPLINSNPLHGNNAIDIYLDEKEFADALESFTKMSRSIDRKYLKSTQRRYAKPMVADMKSSSKSTRIADMISVTTAVKRAGDYGVKVGVVKNNISDFPKFSAPALASVIEYGTAERYGVLKKHGLITGYYNTGSMPSAPFLRPAWDRNVQSLMDNTEKAIIKRIERSV